MLAARYLGRPTITAATEAPQQAPLRACTQDPSGLGHSSESSHQQCPGPPAPACQARPARPWQGPRRDAPRPRPRRPRRPRPPSWRSAGRSGPARSRGCRAAAQSAGPPGPPARAAGRRLIVYMRIICLQRHEFAAPRNALDVGPAHRRRPCTSSMRIATAASRRSHEATSSSSVLTLTHPAPRRPRARGPRPSRRPDSAHLEPRARCRALVVAAGRARRGALLAARAQPLLARWLRARAARAAAAGAPVCTRRPRSRAWASAETGD